MGFSLKNLKITTNTKNNTITPATQASTQQSLPKMVAPKSNSVSDIVSAFRTNFAKFTAASTPVENNARSILGRISSISETDPTRGQDLFNKFQYFQQDKSSPIYNPYTKATNKAFGYMTSLGVDMSGFNGREWLNANSAMKSWFAENSNTYSAKSPTKKSSAKEKIGYNYAQLWDAQDLTDKALTEQSALLQELNYLASRDDLNYSDDYIVNNINWEKDYPTLYKMQKAAETGEPLELNSPITVWNTDGAYGALWASRNPDDEVDIYQAMANSALGKGNKWVENTEISKRLAAGTEDYAPYSVGSTMAKEGMYFNRKSFDQKWIDENKAQYLGSNNETDKKMMQNVIEAEDFTTECEKQLEMMHKDIENLLKTDKSADSILAALKDGTYDYSSLFKLDDSMNTAKLLNTTRTIDYRWQDIEKYVREACDKRDNKGDTIALVNDLNYWTNAYPKTTSPAVSTAPAVSTRPDVSAPTDLYPTTETPVPTQPDVKPTPANTPASVNTPNAFSETDIALEVAAKDAKNKLTDTVEAIGTDEEKATLLTGKTGIYDQSVEKIKTSLADPVAVANKYAQSATQKTVEGYYGSHKTVSEYDDTTKELENAQNELTTITPRLKELSTRKATMESVGGLTREEFTQLSALYRSENPEIDEIRKTIEQGLNYPEYYGQEEASFRYYDAVDRFYSLVTGHSVMESDDTPQSAAEKVNLWLNYMDGGNWRNAENPYAAKMQEDHARGNMQPLTAEEKEELATLQRQEERLQETIEKDTAYINDNKDQYTKAKRASNFLISHYSDAAASNKNMDVNLIPKMDVLYEGTKTFYKHQWTAYSPYDMAVENGTTPEAAQTEAKKTATDAATTAQMLRDSLTMADQYGIALSDEERKNALHNIEELDYAALDAGYYSLDATEGFKDKAEAGKEKAKNSDNRIVRLILGDNLNDFETAFEGISLSPNGSISPRQKEITEEATNARVMSEKEKDRFFCLYETDGEEAALQYFNHLADPDRGVLNVRWNQELAESLQNYSEENALNALIGSVFSVGTRKVAAFDALANVIRGKENPTPSEAETFTDALRGGAQRWVEKNLGGSVAGLVYNVAMGLVDFKTDSALLSPLFSGLSTALEGTALATKFGVKALNFAHTTASVMPGALISADRSYNNTMTITGGDVDKSRQMAGFDFIADLISSSIVMHGTHNMIKADPRGFAGDFSNFATKLLLNGAAAGTAKRFEDRIHYKAEEIVLKDDSTWGQLKQKYLDAYYPESLAEQYADEELKEQITKDIVEAVGMSFIRTGLTFAAKTIGAKIGSRNYGYEQEGVLPYQGTDTRDLAIISAVHGTSPTSTAVGITSVLDTGDPYAAKAAGQALVAKVAGGDPDVATEALYHMALNAPNPAQMKTDVIAAALTKGNGANALSNIITKIQNGENVTSADVNALHNGVEEDRKDPNFDQSVQDAITENRVANKTNDIASQNTTIVSAQDALNKSKTTLANAQTDAENAHAKVDSISESLESVTGLYAPEGAPVDQEAAGLYSQTVNQLEGATTDAQTADNAVAVQEQKVEEAQKKLEDTQNEVMAQARQEAQAEVAQEQQQEAEAAVAQAQEEFEQAQLLYTSTKPFTKAVTVPDVNGNPVKLTGIFAVNGDYETIYTTTDGYISDSAINWDAIYGKPSSDEFYAESDAILDKWGYTNGGKNPISPASWLPHSVKATHPEYGNIIDIVGFYGKTDNPDDPDPIVMDAEGNVYNGIEIMYEGNGFNDMINAFATSEEETGELPVVTDDELYELQHPGTEETPQAQMPEGMKTYHGDQELVEYNGKLVELVGFVPDPDGHFMESKYVTKDGELIDPMDVNESDEFLAFAEDVINATLWHKTSAESYDEDDDFDLEPPDDDFEVTDEDLDSILKQNSGELEFKTLTVGGLFTPEEQIEDVVFAPTHTEGVSEGGYYYEIVGMKVGANSNIYLVTSNGALIGVGEEEYPKFNDVQFISWATHTAEKLKNAQQGVQANYGSVTTFVNEMDKQLIAAAASKLKQTNTPKESTFEDLNGEHVLTAPQPAMVKAGFADVAVVGVTTNASGKVMAYDENGDVVPLAEYQKYPADFAQWAIDHMYALSDPLEMDFPASHEDVEKAKKFFKKYLSPGNMPEGFIPYPNGTASGKINGKSIDIVGIVPSDDGSWGDAWYVTPEGDQYKALDVIEDSMELVDFAKSVLQSPEAAANAQQAQATQTTGGQYTLGKKNPKTGEPLKDWQDPKYHGKVKDTKAKLNPKSKDFKAWQGLDEMSFYGVDKDQGQKYFVDENGKPVIYYRGYGSWSHNLYVSHVSHPFKDNNGEQGYVNFYMDKKSTATSYAGTNEEVKLRYIDNWETAKAAMQDLGLDLVEKENYAGVMGYQVVKNGHAVHGKDDTWFAEDDLKRFRNTYGGKPYHSGIFAGYVTGRSVVVIPGGGHSYSSVPGDVTAPDGEHYRGHMKTRSWAKWLFDHGADTVVFDGVTDNVNGGGEVGVEIVTKNPWQYKSVYNKGSFSTKKDSTILEKVNVRKLMSPQMRTITEKLDLGKPMEDMSFEERQDLAKKIKATPEYKKADSQRTLDKDTLDYNQEKAIQRFDGSDASYTALRNSGVPEETIKLLGEGKSRTSVIESLFTPEDVIEQHRVRDKMALEQGSAVFDESGKAHYTGDVRHDKRLDVLVGLPAAGKSSLADPLSALYKSRILDPDDAKKFHKNYEKGANSSPLHNESRFIMKQAQQIMIDNGDNVILPVVGHSYGSVLKQIQAFKDAGYEVHLHNVHLPWGKAVGRSLNRMVEDNRLLSVDYLLGVDGTQLHPQKINDTFKRLVEEGKVDGWAEWNNDVERYELPEPIGASDPRESDLGVGLSGGLGTDATGGLAQVQSGTGGDTPTGNGSDGIPWDQRGELAPASGRDVGRGDNVSPEQGTGEIPTGRGTEGQTGHLRPDTGRVSERLLSKKTTKVLKSKGVTDLKLREADHTSFSNGLSKAKASNSHGAYVDAQSPEELAEKGAITITSKDGLAGVAIGSKGKYAGNIFGVYKDGKSKAKGASAALIIQAIAQGGDKLDCFDGNLSSMYAKCGMIPVCRVSFVDEYAPDGWNFERDGRPDVVFWMHNGDPAGLVARKYKLSEAEGGYHIPTEEEIQNLPLYDDYDVAWAIRDSKLATRGIVETPNAHELVAGHHNTPAERRRDEVKAKLKSPQDIIENLTTRLGVNSYLGTNKMGKAHARAVGIYDQHAKYMAVKNANLGTFEDTFHELGHWLADRLGINATQSLVDNLKKTDKKLASQYSDDELGDEAIAEFTWRYVESEERARRFAGDEFYEDFEARLAANPEMYEAMQEARTQIQAFLAADYDAQAEALVKYDKGGNRTSIGQIIDSAIYQMIDATHAAADVDQYIKDLTGTNDVPISDSVRSMALLSNHSQKQAVAMLKDNLIDPDGTIIGDGLGKLADSVGFKGTEENLKLWERYALALHSFDPGRVDKPVYDERITPEARTEFINKINNEHPEIKRFHEAFQQFRHEFLQAWMVDTGYWSQEFLDHLEEINPNYVPTFRVGGNVESMRGLGGKSGSHYTVKEAKGSSENIYSPFYSFVGMVEQIVKMVNNNRVARTFDRLYEENEGMGFWARRLDDGDPETAHITPQEGMNNRQEQLMQILDGTVPDDIMEQVLDVVKSNPGLKNITPQNSILTVQREDGTVVRYQFKDPELYQLLAGVQEVTGHPLLSAVGALTRTMSMLTTGSNPVFALRNAVRDFQTSVNYGTWATTYIDGVRKWMQTFPEVWAGKSKDWQQYQALGGGGWTRIDRNNPQTMKNVQEEIFGEDKSNVGKTAKWLGKKIWRLITAEKLNEVIEQTSRFVEYKLGKHDRSTVEGRQEGMLASQDVTVDFSRSGNSRLAHILKRLVAFIGASSQGVYRTGRQFTEAERDMAGIRLMKSAINTGILSAVSIGLILAFCDKDDKEEYGMLSDGVKSGHFILPNPLKGMEGQPPFLRIPIAQDPVSYLVNGLVTNALWNGEDDEAAISTAALADVIIDNLNPFGSGTIFQPFIDAGKNQNYFGGKLVRTSMEDWKDPTGQYNEDTPAVFRFLGNLFNESPEKIEYYVQQYTGFLGSSVLPMISIDKNGNMGGLSALANSVWRKWTADPLSSNDVTNRFYDYKSMLETIKSEGKAERPQGLMLRSMSQEEVNNAYAEAEDLLKSGGLIDKTADLISESYKKIDANNANPALTDAQKNQLNRIEKKKMLQIVQAANEQLSYYESKYIRGETIMDHLIGAAAKRIQPGLTAHVKTTEERLPETFQNDLDNADYMKRAQSVYRESGKSTDLPHPDRKWESKGEKFEIEDDDEWAKYTKTYREKYQEYCDRNGGRWESMTLAEKRDFLSKAHTAANKAMREEYYTDHNVRR